MDYCLRKFYARFCGSQCICKNILVFLGGDSNGDYRGRINHVVLAVESSIVRCQVRIVISRGELLW